MQEPGYRPILRVVFLYVTFAGLWILFSDVLLERLITDPHLLTRLQTYKGWAFVATSALIMGMLLRREIDRRDLVEESRRQSDERRRQSDERYRMLVEQAPDGIMITDEAGGILDVNPAGRTLLNESDLQESTSANFNDYFRSPVSSLLQSRKEGGEPAKMVVKEMELQRRDGSRCPVEISARRLPNGQVQAILRDISERKRTDLLLQRQLRRLAALRSIDIAITGTLDQDVIFEVLLDQVMNELEADAAAVLLLHPVTNRLEYAASRGFLGTAVTQTSLEVGLGLAGLAALREQSLSYPDLNEAGEIFQRSELLGGEGFVTYYGEPLKAKGEVKGVLEVFFRQPFGADDEWRNFLETLAGQAAIAIDNMSLYENLQRTNLDLSRAYDATLEGWSRALELRDQETQGHSHRVTDLTLRLAERLGIPHLDLIHIRRGTLLHDIGKMGVPDSILLKPGPLTQEEWTVMRKHPIYAFEMLFSIPFLRPAIDIPYCHHERWDGKGYPRGLRGEEIPLAARIFSAVDVWDALRSNRPYRKAWTEEKVSSYLREKSGVQFDPLIIDQFLEMIRSEALQ